MLSPNKSYIASLANLFYTLFNNQDDSCSLTSSNAENKLYHRKGMCHTESLKTE